MPHAAFLSRYLGLPAAGAAVVATREITGDDVGYFISAELPLCSVILPDQTVLLCRSGEMRVVAAANNELKGDYALTLSDGQLRTGTFRARHCPGARL